MKNWLLNRNIQLKDIILYGLLFIMLIFNNLGFKVSTPAQAVEINTTKIEQLQAEILQMQKGHIKDIKGIKTEINSVKDAINKSLLIFNDKLDAKFDKLLDIILGQTRASNEQT